MSCPGREPLWIGVDGGASAVKVRAVARGEGGLVTLGEPVERVYGDGSRFARVTRWSETPPAAAEREAARARVEATARSVAELARALDAGQVALGVAWPGLKTPDRRGVAWARHAPRDPDLLGRLEQRLAAEGVELAVPAVGLFSDGECASRGEHEAASGSLRGVRNGWYLGGGTGLAEGLVLAGRPLAPESLSDDLPRAWQLERDDGTTVEDALSARGLNARAGGAVEERVAVEPAARAVLEQAVAVLADLAARRARDLLRHAGVELERVVVGQRLAAILADPRCAFARDALERALEARDLPALGWLVLSELRAAPAIGAAAHAMDAWEAARA